MMDIAGKIGMLLAMTGVLVVIVAYFRRNK